MTRHDTAQQTADSRQLIITTQAYTRHDTTRRDGIHDPCVCRVAGETSARCHARSSQHGRSVRRIGEKWPTRHRPQGVVISGQWWAVGTGGVSPIGRCATASSMVDGQHPGNIAFAKFEQMPPTEPRHRHLPPCAPTCLSVIGQLRSCRTPTGPPRPIGCQRIREFANLLVLT